MLPLGRVIAALTDGVGRAPVLRSGTAPTTHRPSRRSLPECRASPLERRARIGPAQGSRSAAVTGR